MKKEKEEMKKLEEDEDETWKDLYYKEKFKFTYTEHAGAVRKLVQSYLEVHIFCFFELIYF